MERRNEIISLDAAQVSRLVEETVPGVMVRRFELLPGGKANTNYRVETDRRPLVLRLYTRDGTARDKELALFEWLNDVPVPAVHGFGESEHTPYAVLSLCAGRPLDIACARFGAAEWKRTGRSIGRALAKIHARRFERPGNLVGRGDAGQRALAVEPWPFEGVLGFMRRCVAQGPAATRLGAARCRALLALVEDEEVDASVAALTHGDFNATNLHVDEEGELTGVLDWEFAHAGDPLMDLGNLLRDDPDRNPPLPEAFTDALLAELRLPSGWRERATFIDVSSALELLSSEADRPATHARALQQIDAFIRSHSA